MYNDKQKKELPLISVIVPTYNRGYIITEALKSITAQTLQNYEIIVVDDGSTDTTKKIIDDFGDNRIRYIKHSRNMGLATALNTGFRAARADFLAELSTDDTWIQNTYLSKTYEALFHSSEEIGAVYTGMLKEHINGSENLTPPADLEKKEGMLYEEFLKQNFTGFQAMVIKKEAFEKVGGIDEQLLAVQDWDFLIRFSHMYKFLYIPETMVRVPILNDSITKNQKKRLFYREMIFNKHISEFKKRPVLCAQHAYNIGHAFALTGNITKAHTYIALAAKNDHTKIKYVLALLLSLANSATFYNFIVKSFVKNKKGG